MIPSTQQTFLPSAAFLLHHESSQNVFSPDDFSEEQQLLRQSLHDFLAQHVEARYLDFDSAKGFELAPELLEKMGALGFLGIGVPEAYAGFDADFRTQLAFGEIAYSAWAFGLSVGVQTSLGVAPLLLYGTEEQKARYLPGIVAGELKSCYCLTEPGAGSDANAGKTRARLSPDGKEYRLSGQKMWITGSGYADIFFVFAKIDDDPNLSCLIVEKAFGGIRLGAEEKKMGIKGSSTRQVFFEDVPVPQENLLGERNGGFKIALNVLNTGRIKMATSVTGNAKRALGYGTRYAMERVQFGQAIAQFGAIQHKLGAMMAHIYAMESMAYRVGGSIDQAYDQLVVEGMPELEAKYRSIAEFALECALVKVHNTEAEAFVIDEALQIHGGMGYSTESPIETLYRNARINRIYEGTNEINRLLLVDQLIRKVLSGKLNLMSETPDQYTLPLESLPAPRRVLAKAKQLTLQLCREIITRLGAQLKQEQEVMIALADILIQVYALESVILRTEKYLLRGGSKDAPWREACVALQALRTAQHIRTSALEIVLALPGIDQVSWIETINQLSSPPLADARQLRRQAAAACMASGAYPLEPTFFRHLPGMP